MDQDRSPYISYMLRLWIENDRDLERTIRGQAEWRASLEDPHTQEMQVFANIKALFAFLQMETDRRMMIDDTI